MRVRRKGKERNTPFTISSCLFHDLQSNRSDQVVSSAQNLQLKSDHGASSPNTRHLQLSCPQRDPATNPPQHPQVSAASLPNLKGVPAEGGSGRTGLCDFTCALPKNAATPQPASLRLGLGGGLRPSARAASSQARGSSFRVI